VSWPGTTGDHLWRQEEVYPFLATHERTVRPLARPRVARGPTATALGSEDDIRGLCSLSKRAHSLDSGTSGWGTWGCNRAKDHLVFSKCCRRCKRAEHEAQFDVADGAVRLDAALIAAEGGRATAIETLEVLL